MWVNTGRKYPVIFCFYAYGRKGCSQEESEVAQTKRKYQMLESHTDGQKQNVLTLTNKPNAQMGDAHVYWTLKARAEQLKHI